MQLHVPPRPFTRGVLAIAGALAAISATAATVPAAAAPTPLRGAATVRTVTLKPGGHAVLTFRLQSPAYSVRAVLSTAADSDFPFVEAFVSQPGNAGSQAWTLASARHGQVYAGRGPVSGVITVKLRSLDDAAVKVSLRFAAASSASAHRWVQSTDLFSLYPVAHANAKADVLASVARSIASGDQAFWYVPLRNGGATLHVHAGGSTATVYVTSLAPGVTKPLETLTVQAGKSGLASIALPHAPCLLTIANTGSHKGSFRARITW